MASTPPTITIPPGNTLIQLSLINTTNFGPAQLHRFMAPAVPGVETFKSSPSFSFLLKHPSGRQLVWDLGIRKDYANYSPQIASYIPTTKYNIEVDHDVADILSASGTALEKIEAVIWSHWHWDHIGNPATFPSTTALVVGKGFKNAMLPGAPANPDSPILEADYANRELREITFDGPDCLKIGEFPAYDYFGDGSFYLLDSPGHAVGHMCGLVRTTSSPDTFVLLGGDICHYAGIFRPSKYMPFPEDDRADSHACGAIAVCPGKYLRRLQHSRNRQLDEPVYRPTYGHDIPLAERTISKLQQLDCDDRIWTIIAHDRTVRDSVDHFPEVLNGWKDKGWGSKTRWIFLRDFEPFWNSQGSQE